MKRKQGLNVPIIPIVGYGIGMNLVQASPLKGTAMGNAANSMLGLGMMSSIANSIEDMPARRGRRGIFG